MKVFIFLIAVILFGCEDDPHGSSSILKQVWKVKLNKVMGLQGFEIPAIDGNYAYFPNGPDIECRELATGKLIWKKRVTNGTRDYVGTNFDFNSKIIVINDAFSTRALDKLTGEQLWIAADSGTQRDYGFMSDIDEKIGYYSPFIANARQIYRYDINTGSIINEIRNDSGGINSVVLSEMGLFVNTLVGVDNENGEELYTFGTVKKLDPITGEPIFVLRNSPKWYDFGGYGEYLGSYPSLFTVPILDENVGYSLFKDGTVFKFDLVTGEMIWKYVLPLNEYHHDFPEAISLLLDREKRLVFVTGKKHSWYCIDSETGKQLYWKVLNSEDGVGNIDASSYDGNRYVFKPHPHNSNEWYIIDITTGEVVEEFDIPGDSILSQDVKNGYIAAFGVLNFYVFKIVR